MTELWRHINFSRWRLGHSNSTSGIGFRDFAHLGRSKSTCAPNFGEISQSAAEILLHAVPENKCPPCWNSTSGSDFYVCITIGMSICICLPNFVQIGPYAAELWHHINFSRWRPSAILNYLKVTADDPRIANAGLRLVLKFRLDRIDSFRDIAISVLWGFGLKLPIYMVVAAAHAQNEGLIYFRGRKWPHILICGVDLPIHHPISKGVAGRLRGVYWRSPPS